jgi:hypothetical protein
MFIKGCNFFQKSKGVPRAYGKCFFFKVIKVINNDKMSKANIFNTKLPNHHNLNKSITIIACMHCIIGKCIYAV